MKARMFVIAPLVYLYATPAEAIIRRHDVSDSLYLSFGAEEQFSPVGRVLGMPGSGGSFWNGSGTLISDRFVLTAAHVVDDASLGWGFDFGMGTQVYNAASVHIHPGWGNGLGFEGAGDMALIELDRAVTGYTPARLASTPIPYGLEVALVGFGGAGNGINGWNGTYDMLRRAGTNIIEPAHNAFAADILSFVFDGPDSTQATAMEAMGMFGDSGGAVMGQVNGLWEILGVHSFIASAGDPYGVYGDWTGSTSVYSYLPWINSIVPAPSTFGLFGFALAVTARRRR